MPLPYLKSIASLVARRMMSSIVSSTVWMKQALPCGYSYCVARPLGLPGLAIVKIISRPGVLADAVLMIEADVEPDRAN